MGSVVRTRGTFYSGYGSAERRDANVCRRGSWTRERTDIGRMACGERDAVENVSA